MSESPFGQVCSYLKLIGLDQELLNYLDSMDERQQLDFTELLKEISKDEVVHIISLRDVQFIKDYLERKVDFGIVN